MYTRVVRVPTWLVGTVVVGKPSFQAFWLLSISVILMR